MYCTLDRSHGCFPHGPNPASERGASSCLSDKKHFKTMGRKSFAMMPDPSAGTQKTLTTSSNLSASTQKSFATTFHHSASGCKSSLMTFCPVPSAVFSFINPLTGSTSGEKRRNVTNCPIVGRFIWFTTFSDPLASRQR